MSMHSDAVAIKLFRHVIIDEVYGVHWFADTSDDSSQDQRHRADSHTDSYLDSTTSQNKKDLTKDRILPPARKPRHGARETTMSCLSQPRIVSITRPIDARAQPRNPGYPPQAMSTPKNNTITSSTNYIPRIDSTKAVRV